MEEGEGDSEEEGDSDELRLNKSSHLQSEVNLSSPPAACSRCGHASDSRANPYAKPALSHSMRDKYASVQAEQIRGAREAGLNLTALKPIYPLGYMLAEEWTPDVRVQGARPGEQLVPVQPGQGSGTRQREHRQRSEPRLSVPGQRAVSDTGPPPRTLQRPVGLLALHFHTLVVFLLV
ncbi:unnamed protein product [Pleuronectes platessa]|uniref:Uncharacterized protein n=1 Tax=Pleuronectes platessa TaxID=8262 RepID=A0A9N7V2J0_PLEPL|nr:unnamed protein product [Pleuronectes platessa]